MSNVVSLASFRKPAPPVMELPNNNPPQEALSFVTDVLYHWALDNNIDIESHDFKFESATILTVLQGMLFRAKS